MKLGRKRYSGRGSAESFNLAGKIVFEKDRRADDIRIGEVREEIEAKKPVRQNAPDLSHDRGNAPSVIDTNAEMPHRLGAKRVIWTGKNHQIVTERIGTVTAAEQHRNEGGDIAIYVKSGEGEAVIGKGKCRGDTRHPLFAGCELIIPDGAYWYICGSDKNPLEIIACYAPRRYSYGYSE